MKRIFAVFLLGCLVLSLCACEQFKAGFKKQPQEKEDPLSMSNTCLVFCDYVTYDAEGNEIYSVSIPTGQAGLPGSFTASDQTSFSFVYDEASNLIHFDRKKEPNALSYVFDENGNCTQCSSIHQGDELISEATYDNFGNILSIKEYSSGQIIRQREFNYNENGKLIRYQGIWGIDTESDEYDANGNLIKHISYDGSYEEHEYDGNGNKTHTYKYDREGKEEEHLLFQYNHNNDLTTQIVYKFGKEYERYTYEYIHNNDFTTQIVYKFGKEYERYTCEYDASGNKTSSKHLKNNAEKKRTEYTYDSNGYLTQQVEYENGTKNESTVYSNYRVQRLTVGQKAAFESLTINNHFAMNLFSYWSFVPYDGNETTTNDQKVPESTSGYSDTTMLIGEVHYYDDDYSITASANQFGLPQTFKGKLKGRNASTGNYYYTNSSTLETIEYTYYYEGAEEATSTLQFDSNGNCIKLVTYSGTKEISRIESEYDNNNNLIKRYANNNGQEIITECTYDHLGNPTQISYDYGTRKDSYKYEHIYDSHNNIIETTQYYNGTATARFEYEYDEKSNLLKKVSFDGNEEKERIEYEYDQYGNLTKETEYRWGELDNCTEYNYEYDSRGNIVKESRSKDIGSWTEYEYDSNGVLSQKRFYENNELVYSFTTTQVTKLTESQKRSFESVKDLLFDLETGWMLIK